MKVCSAILIAIIVGNIVAEPVAETTCSTNSGTTFTTNGKTLFFFLELSSLTSQAVQNLAQNIAVILNTEEATHPGWINNVVIYAFFPSQFVLDVKLSVAFNPTDPNLAKTLNELADAAETHGYNCALELFSAFNDGFKRWKTLLAGASVILITSAPELNDQFNLVLAATEDFGVQTPVVDVIRIENNICILTAWNTTYFDAFIQSTNGVVTRAEPDETARTVGMLLSARKAPQKLADIPLTGCYGTYEFQLDSVTTNDVYILLSGDISKDVTITLSQGPNVISPATYMNLKHQNMWRFNHLQPGNYQLKLNSYTHPCFPAVFATAGVQVYIAFSPARNLDTATKNLYQNYANFPVFMFGDSHGSQVLNGIALQQTITNYRSGDHTGSVTSSISPRSNCAFPYVTDDQLVCQYADIFTVIVKGTDGNGAPITRMRTSFCVGGVPPIDPNHTVSPLHNESSTAGSSPTITTYIDTTTKATTMGSLTGTVVLAIMLRLLS